MLRRFFLVLAVVGIPLRAAAQEAIVDLELVLAVDASSSIDAGEFRLQLDGIARAFGDRRVLSAIQSGRVGQIAVAMVLWADASLPVDESDWFIVASEADAERFSSFVYATRRRAIGGTGIGAGISWAIRKFDRNGIAAERQVVDVSGDGRETPPRETVVTISTARSMALSRGVTINGLAILNEDETLASWYANNVTAGPNSFVISVEGFETFAEAMIRKLIREIEDQPRIGALRGDADAVVIPKVLTIDPYDGPKSSAGKARPKRRCRASSKGRNDVRRAILGHRRPDFCGFWMSLQLACGTRTTAPIAPNQNPHKCRSYRSIVRTFGITDWRHPGRQPRRAG